MHCDNQSQYGILWWCPRLSMMAVVTNQMTNKKFIQELDEEDFT